MKSTEALEAMWKALDKAAPLLRKRAAELHLLIQQRKPDEAGEVVKDALREAIEIYTRMGVIAALEEVE